MGNIFSFKDDIINFDPQIGSDIFKGCRHVFHGNLCEYFTEEDNESIYTLLTRFEVTKNVVINDTIKNYFKVYFASKEDAQTFIDLLNAFTQDHPEFLNSTRIANNRKSHFYLKAENWMALHGFYDAKIKDIESLAQLLKESYQDAVLQHRDPNVVNVD